MDPGLDPGLYCKLKKVLNIHSLEGKLFPSKKILQKKYKKFLVSGVSEI